MFCSRCGRPLPDVARFCPACGTEVKTGPGVPPLPGSPEAPSSRLLSLEHLSMSQDTQLKNTPFQFADSFGQVVGAARGEGTIPFINYTLFDDRQQAVLVLDAERIRGLTFDYRIHDAAGTVLATLEMKPPSWGRDRGVTVSTHGLEFGITINGRDAMLLALNATSTEFQLLELGSGAVLATAKGEWAMRLSRTEIDISRARPVDHRIVLGAFIVAGYITGGRRRRSA